MRKVILFYRTMWDRPLDYPLAAIPAPYVLTTDRTAADEAVAIVFHVPTLSPSTLTELTKKDGQSWIAWCMECEANYPQMSDPDFMDHFDLTMTYRLDSEIAAPYLQPSVPPLLRKTPAEKGVGKLLNAFVSSPFNQSGRLEFLLQLMSHAEVHSYGKIFRNRPVEGDQGRETKLETIKSYKFTLALENAIAKDYVTEKFYDPLIVGSVPVYLGAPNIEDFAPGDGCFINAADWKSPEALVRHLVEVARDESFYASFFEWKAKPFRTQFSQLIDLIEEHPFVRLCKKVDELRIDRSFDNGLRRNNGECKDFVQR